jgi:alkanesulfonate monooxygenase SsuD/methylene tetrahydromethanopterin reductase-like flavin-dependent oxidoreductase (luciferase family)
VVDVALMVEGQSGLTWPRWQRICLAAESLGFAGLYRSDHLVSAQPPDEDTLELFTSLTWLASHTSRLEFGTLVSPLTFRHPVHLAQSARSLDELSGGRFILGLGAGWSRREHHMYGFEMYSPKDRMDRLEEGLTIITSLLHGTRPLTFEGRYFNLNEAVIQPRPKDPQSPPILVAGRGRNRGLPLAACYADAWNAMFVRPAELAEMNALLDDLLVNAGRKPHDLGRTVMQGVEVGRTDTEVEAKLRARAWAFWREPGLFAGGAAQLRDRLGEFERAGADQVILQWLDLDDLDGLEVLANALL